jgi:hypothetical protein
LYRAADIERDNAQSDRAHSHAHRRTFQLLACDLHKTRFTRSQVETNPPIETERYISSFMEVEHNCHYRYPPWESGCAAGRQPLAMKPALQSSQAWHGADQPASAVESSDVHLHSVREVAGYHVVAGDLDIGHVEDFLFEEGSWAIHYLVIDTQDWSPGRHVLVSTRHIDSLSGLQRLLHLDIVRADVEQSPEYRRPRQRSVPFRL